MLSKYTLIIKDSWGNISSNKYSIIDDYISLDLARKVNDVGAIDFTLKGNFDTSILYKDGIVEVWHSVGSYPAYLVGDTFFFIRKVDYITKDDGSKQIKVTAEDSISLLKRRFVPYDETREESIRYLPADNMIKIIFYDTFIYNSFYAERDISSAYIAVDSNTSSVIEVYKNCSWRGILDIFQEIVKDVATQGVYLAFDLIKDGEAKLKLYTYTVRRGIDKTSLYFSEENGNLVNPILSTDYTVERNRVYVKGRLATDLQVLTSPTEYQPSPFSMYEDIVTAGNLSGYYYDLIAEGNAALGKSKPKNKLTAKLANVESCVYGVHYKYGDTITVIHNSKKYTCHLDAINISVDGDKESITMSVDAELYV